MGNKKSNPNINLTVMVERDIQNDLAYALCTMGSLYDAILNIETILKREKDTVMLQAKRLLKYYDHTSLNFQSGALYKKLKE